LDILSKFVHTIYSSNSQFLVNFQCISGLENFEF